MNAKRWFAWVCLALMLLAEILLFRSNHVRDQALADLRDAQRQLYMATNELNTLKSASPGDQANTIASLRKQNEVLTAKANALQTNVDRLQALSQQTAQRLNTARDALILQQESLEKLRADQQRAALLANAAACINNLRQMDAAKQQWALDKNKAATDIPTAQDLAPYFKDGTFPVCPDGGTYTINPVNELPTCSLPNHTLAAQ